MIRAIRVGVCVAAFAGFHSAAAFAAVFRVTNVSDTGPGSLRQAILDSNRTPGPNVIEIDLADAASPIIKVERQFLPPLKGPVTVRVLRRAAAPPSSTADKVVLDGSSLVKPRTPSACPGETAVYNTQSDTWEYSSRNGEGANVRGYYGAGLAVHDSRDVEISGLEIRNFCIGIAAVRSSNVYIHDVRIVDSHGAAGVIFTGDDGSSGRTDLSFNNRLIDSELIDNGDGFEFTRGTHDSLIQGTTITLTQPLPVQGNAIEFASSGDNNAVIGNTFSKYVETAVVVSGNHHTFRDNRFIDNEGSGLRGSGRELLIVGNTFSRNGGSGLSVTGAGSRVIDNIISHNAGPGIVISSTGVRLSRNSIDDNAHLGIDVAAASGQPGEQSPRPELPPPPGIDGASKWTAGGLVIAGTISGAPRQTYAIEIFISRAADRHAGSEHGWGEGEMYLGTASTTTDAAGAGTFHLSMQLADPFGDGTGTAWLTATATDPAGTTSTFSRALPIAREPR